MTESTTPYAKPLPVEPEPSSVTGTVVFPAGGPARA